MTLCENFQFFNFLNFTCLPTRFARLRAAASERAANSSTLTVPSRSVLIARYFPMQAAGWVEGKVSLLPNSEVLNT
jgi:hypothetical protein